jgi:DNA-binding NarL/FixJ family response regulator
VFKNTFTRQGRTFALSGWAFKVQYQGRRRTFALWGRTRVAAATEAQRLYETIRIEGWESAISWHAGLRRAELEAGRIQGEEKTVNRELDHWEQRLVRRRYHEARLVCGPECSVRIEHNGAFHFFPLGSEDPKAAAQRALEIHRAIVDSGWEAAFESYSREITMAIFWSENPLAVTYTTLYTFVGAPPPATRLDRSEFRFQKRVAVLEPDATAQNCVQFWLDRQPGFSCPQVFNGADDLCQGLEAERATVTMINRAWPEYGHLVQSLQERFREMPVFTYRLHEESDQIFISISGVSGGYILRRRLPEALFDPMRPAAQARSLSTAEAKRHVHDYFQNFFGSPTPNSDAVGMETLTQREQEIFNHMSKGYLDKEIAHHLNLSVWTVHNHVKHIYEKLKVHNRTEAVLKYLQK